MALIAMHTLETSSGSNSAQVQRHSPIFARALFRSASLPMALPGIQKGDVALERMVVTFQSNQDQVHMVLLVSTNYA